MQTEFDDIFALDAWFGATPGDDYVLIDWEPMCDWIDAASNRSPMLYSQILGQSTDGRELRAVVASSPETIGDLDAFLTQRQQLRNTSLFHDPAIGAGDVTGRKPVVLITAGIHATEVGGVQLMPALIRDLATDPAWAAVLERIIVVIVPTLNPDGMDVVHRWYRQTLGTRAEGTSPPALYHRYAGHDNNRDWYQRRLQETRVVLDEVHRAWFPHVVVDLHQMGQRSPRYVVPPYIDPAELHVHPLVYQLAGELGTRIVNDHTRAGNRGVCSGVMFDCYSPTRAYMHYHGGVRILAEAASAAIASPVHVAESEINHFSDIPARFSSVHMPLPFRGGTWHLEDIIRYHRGTIDSVLRAVASEADRWVADQWTMLRDQVTKTNFGTYVMPPLHQQVDPAAAHELLELLQQGDVEVYVAETDDTIVRAGSFVIPVQQPFGNYAETLLDLLIYPPGNQAYDVTSHCLPIHMGVMVEYFDYTYAGGMHEPTPDEMSPFRAATAAEVRPNAALAIDSRSTAAVRLVNHALATGAEVVRTARPHVADGHLIPPGTWMVHGGATWDIKAHAARMHVRTSVTSGVPDTAMPVKAPRIAIFNPQHGSAPDYGWLTLWLERSGFVPQHLTTSDILHGGLEKVDCILFPHASPDILRDAHRQQWPEPYSHGLSGRVLTMLRTWMRRGGHVIAFAGAATHLIAELDLDISEPLQRLSNREFTSSGAIVRVTPSTDHLAMVGIDEPFPAMHIGKHGYIARGSVSALATFATTVTVISGALVGEDALAGLHAIVQGIHGSGLFTAFAFQPHFRTQMLASEHALTNVIMQARGNGGSQ